MMSATPIEILLSRKSHNKLVEPAPTSNQVEIMMQAALRAPDHGLLKPWRYKVYTGDSLNILSDAFVKIASKSASLTPEQIKKLRSKPHRAPMVIVAIVNLMEHHKVPEIEQILSSGASTQNLMMAAHFMGIGAIWRTGNLAFDRGLMNELGLATNESIVGFIYLGREKGLKKAVPQIEQSEYVSWV